MRSVGVWARLLGTFWIGAAALAVACGGDADPNGGGAQPGGGGGVEAEAGGDASAEVGGKPTVGGSTGAAAAAGEPSGGTQAVAEGGAAGMHPAGSEAGGAMFEGDAGAGGAIPNCEPASGAPVPVPDACAGLNGGLGCSQDQLCAAATCRAPRSWHDVEPLEDGKGAAFSPVLSLANGRAAVIWGDYFNNVPVTKYNNEIWVSLRDQAGKWSEPFELDAVAPGADTAPNITLDPQGNAVAIWNELVGNAFEIWVRRFSVGAGWGQPVRLETPNAYYAFSPKVVSDTKGNVIASWYESIDFDDPKPDEVWTARFTPDGGWSEPERLDTGAATRAFGQHVAFGPRGDALAIWTESDGQSFSVWTRHYHPASGWGDAELLEQDSGDSYSYQVEFDRFGNAFAVWSQETADGGAIWARRYQPGCGWLPATKLHTNAKPSYVPYIAFGSRGEAICAWYERNAADTLNIWASHYDPRAGWGNAKVVSARSVDAYVPEVAIDDDGRALLVWYEGRFPGGEARTVQYDPKTGWSESALLASELAERSYSPHVGFLPNGDALAVWYEGVSTTSVVTRSFR